MTVIEQILDLARWAPSGDNTQPWRFQILADDHVVVHGNDTRDHVVYDLDGHASHIALGALLQTIEIAASRYGQGAHITRRPDSLESRPVFDIRFTHDQSITESELAAAITTRATHRRVLRTRRLSSEEKAALQRAAAPECTIHWWESVSERWGLARFLYRNARLRLITPEAFEVHRSIVDWNATTSVQRVPDRALGLNPAALRLTRWAFGDWSRMRLLNAIPGATVAPRLELDLVPALACGAHYALLANEPPDSLDDFVAAGKAVQRVWLKLTQLGLWQQPEMTPLIFSRFVRNGPAFTRDAPANRLARRISQEFDRLLPPPANQRAVWLARVGAGRGPIARSVRLPLSDLMLSNC